MRGLVRSLRTSKGARCDRPHSAGAQALPGTRKPGPAPGASHPWGPPTSDTAVTRSPRQDRGRATGRTSVPETPAPPRASSTARAGPRVGQGVCPSPRVHSAAQDSPADVRGVPLSCPALLRERRACRWLAASAGWERGLPGGQTPGPSGHLTRGAPWHEAASAQTARAPSGGQHGLALSTLCSENDPQHTLLSPSSTRGAGGTPHHPQAWPRRR